MRWSLCTLILITSCAHQPAPSPPRPVRIATADALAILALDRELSSSPEGAPRRFEAEWELVQALERAELLNLTFIYAVRLVRTPLHPHQVDGLETLARLQELRQDDFLIPSLFNTEFQKPSPPALSAPAMARVAWLRARIAFRRGKHADALALCAQVPAGAPVFARTQYLKAIMLTDVRVEGGAGAGEAATILERLAGPADPKQEGGEQVREQALLALGRLAYGQKRWADSVRWYEQAAQLAPIRARALFEQSFAFMQQRDWVSALARLRSGEVRNSGLTEASLTEAMVLHYSGDPAAAEVALEQARHGPETVDWNEAEPARAADAWRTGRGVAPEPLALAREDRRLARLFASIESFELERRLVLDTAEWRGTGTAASFAQFLTQNLETLQKTSAILAHGEFKELQRFSSFHAQAADLVGIEVALARRDLNGAIGCAERTLTALQGEGGPVASDLMFRLAALKQARAEVLTGAEAAQERLEVAQLIARILGGDQTWPRLEEARRFGDLP
ncbi:MAG: hypothetical protein Q8L48_29350 [Archangium sp.]|nr:hypothetical protein [Archangium sp.]